jgi:ABC-type multidrug transport system ATPase subunit
MEFHYLLLYVFVFLIFFIIPILSSKGITWNISATTNDGKKQILKNVVGYSKEGKLHAILGPSGSGKTTFLNSIAESIPYKSLKVYGTLSSTFPSNPIFVPQEDLLFAQLTVDETLITSSELKQLKTNSNHQTVISRVSSLILDLGLKKVKNTRVGNAKTRGISGGEKKRLSIGNELAGSSEDSRDIKKLIFCDEPTSGLDSFQAEKVMQLLKDITKNGSTVIASIHQPRSSIYTLFDEITLLSEGLVIYSGDATKMEQYFSSIGYPCPKHVNPAEYYIDLVSIDYSSPEIEKVCRERINNLSEAFIQSNVYYQTVQISNKIESTVKAIGDKHNQIKRFKPSLKTRLFNSIKTFRTLFIRAWRQVTRDKPLNIARLASNLFSGLLFGAIYYKLSNGANTVGDRLGLLQVAAINTAMTAVMKATTSFVTEKLIVQRERRTETYAVFPYFLSKLMAEVPLSAFFPCLFGVIMYKLCGLNPAPGRLLKFLSILTVVSNRGLNRLTYSHLLL